MSRPTEQQIMEFLERPFWPERMETNQSYFRTHDDCDGDAHKGLHVAFSIDGDAWIETSCSCRFRTGAGGGASLRVRSALLILAMAIDADNQERPFHPRADLVPSLPEQPETCEHEPNDNLDGDRWRCGKCGCIYEQKYRTKPGTIKSGRE